MKSILDPSFRYTNSAQTDLRKTFARIRREQRQQTKAQQHGSSKVFALAARKCTAS
jgi:hypothetical protein